MDAAIFTFFDWNLKFTSGISELTLCISKGTYGYRSRKKIDHVTKIEQMWWTPYNLVTIKLAYNVVRYHVRQVGH